MLLGKYSALICSQEKIYLVYIGCIQSLICWLNWISVINFVSCMDTDIWHVLIHDLKQIEKVS